MCYRKITNRQGISSEGLKNEPSTIKKVQERMFIRWNEWLSWTKNVLHLLIRTINYSIAAIFISRQQKNKEVGL